MPQLVKRLTPTVLGFLMILSAAFFKDETGALLRLLHGVLITNRVLCEHVELLTQQLGEGSVEESHSSRIHDVEVKFACFAFQQITKRRPKRIYSNVLLLCYA